MSSNVQQTIGWQRNLLYYTPYFGGYWYKEGLAAKAHRTLDKVNAVVDDPASFAKNATAGTIAGVSEGIQGLRTHQVKKLNGVQREENFEDMSIETLWTRIGEWIAQGAAKPAAAAFSFLLSLAETENPALAQAQEVLQRAQEEEVPLLSTITKAYNLLASQHIVFLGWNFSQQKYSSETLREERLKAEKIQNVRGRETKAEDCKSPNDALRDCLHCYDTLRTAHNLLPIDRHTPSVSSVQRLAPEDTSPEEKEEIQRLQNKTNAKIAAFCEKTAHYSTMYAMRTLLPKKKMKVSELNAFLQTDDPQQEYLNRIGGGRLQQFIYKSFFRIIHKFFEPIIRETILGVTTHLREFLEDDIKVRAFAKKKFGDLTEYFERIEGAREDFLSPKSPDHPGYEAGRFATFLKRTIRKYGDKELTEAELTKQFGDYIISSYVPRPRIAIRKHRIFLASSALERGIHAARKLIVKLLLQRAKLVDTMLTRGTDTGVTTQLGIKRMLLSKLQEIEQMVKRSRPRNANEGDAEKQTRLHLEAKKSKVITEDLLLVMQENSESLHQFIAIQKCNNSRNKLRDLNNPVNKLFYQAYTAAREALHFDDIRFRATVINSTTNLLQTTFFTLLADKEKQIEKQMQGIIEILDQAYSPELSRDQQLARLAQETAQLASVESQIAVVQQEISHVAIQTTLEDYFKNATVERHAETEEFVAKEREELDEIGAYLTAQEENLKNLLQNYDPASSPIAKVKEEVNRVSTCCEEYLRKTARVLNSSEFKSCYTDVRGDLNNAYGLMISHLKAFADDTLIPALELIAEIEELENNLQYYRQAQQRLTDLSPDLSLEKAEVEFCRIEQHIPIELKNLRQLWARLEIVNQRAYVFNKLEKLKEKRDELVAQKRQLDTVSQQLTELSDWVRELHDLKGPNRTYRTQQAVKARRKSLISWIDERYQELIHIEDPDIKNYVLNLLSSGDPEALFKQFNPHFLKVRRQVPIFTALNRYQSILQSMVKSNDSEQTELKQRASRFNEEQLRTEQKAAVRSIQEEMQNVQNAIEEASNKTERSLKKSLKQLMSFPDHFTYTGWDLQWIADEMHVTPYISFGEHKLLEEITPTVGEISPLISKSMKYLLNALSDPFHYKQLMLRLVLLEVVEGSQP